MIDQVPIAIPVWRCEALVEHVPGNEPVAADHEQRRADPVEHEADEELREPLRAVVARRSKQQARHPPTLPVGTNRGELRHRPCDRARHGRVRARPRLFQVIRADEAHRFDSATDRSTLVLRSAAALAAATREVALSYSSSIGAPSERPDRPEQPLRQARAASSAASRAW